jgi:glycerol transport system ATP-binding protein
MIYVTHDQTEALTFADKVVVMHDGRVVQLGTPEDLFETPEHTFVGYFIGSPGMNLLDAEVSGHMASVAGHALALGGSYKALTGRVQIGVRPEFVTLSDGEDGLPVTIKRIEDVGRHQILRAEFAGTPVNAILPEGMTIPAGANRLKFQPDRINVYVDDWRVAPLRSVATPQKEAV